MSFRRKNIKEGEDKIGDNYGSKKEQKGKIKGK
jgi:hypothetical protein